MTITLNGTTGITTPAVSSTGNSTFTGSLALPSGGLTVGTDQLVVDTAGRVTMPYQPSMFAQPDSNVPVQVGTGVHTFGWNTSGSIRYNRGFTLSGASVAGIRVFNANSTGRITVPADGVYALYVDMRCESVGSSGQAGVFINGTQYIRRHIEEWGTIAYNHCIVCANLNLSANDFIEIGFWWNSTAGGPQSGTSDTVNWMSLAKIS